MNQTKNEKVVLVVEDDAALQKIIKEGLQELSIDVIQATSGSEALSHLKLEHATPNLILLDIMLPGGMNGFDVLEQVKKEERLKEIPVIVLTNLESERKTALSIGAIDYIVKPSLSIDELLLKIRNNIK